MKRQPEYVEGPEAFTRFQDAMKRVLGVPHVEIQRRIEAERKPSLAIPIGAGRSERRETMLRLIGVATLFTCLIQAIPDSTDAQRTMGLLNGRFWKTLPSQIALGLGRA